jgi:lycopene cyclase domain-containing protein
MSEYLLINIVVIIVPAILTFERKLKFYKNQPAVFLSILVVGLVYLIWDIVATERGDWSFNEKYLLGVTIFNLPLEEVLFFITIPYAVIFLFETAKYYIKDNEIVYYCRLYTYASAFFILSSLLFINQTYTMTVLLFTGIYFLTAKFLNPSLLRSKIYWYFIMFTYLPFFIVNYILTSLPIVSYGDQAIWGIKVFTIPVEDFFYSFTLLSFNLLIYTKFKEKWLRKK